MFLQFKLALLLQKFLLHFGVHVALHVGVHLPPNDLVLVVEMLLSGARLSLQRRQGRLVSASIRLFLILRRSWSRFVNLRLRHRSRLLVLLEIFCGELLLFLSIERAKLL